MLTHLSQTSDFYQRPSVISKKSFLLIAKRMKPPCPPFQCWHMLRGHRHMVTTLKRREGVEMWILEIKKLTRSMKQVFFGECLNCFCPWLKILTKIPFKKKAYLKCLWNLGQAYPDLITLPETNKISMGLVRSCQDCQDIKILKEFIIIHHFISGSNARINLAVIDLQLPQSMSSKFSLDDTVESV